MPNAADPRQRERSTNKERTRARQELLDLKAVLATPVGRRFIWSRLERCGVFRSIWSDSVLIHFNEGRRNVGLELIADIANADENAFLQMMTEAHVADAAEARADHTFEEVELKKPLEE